MLFSPAAYNNYMSLQKTYEGLTDNQGTTKAKEAIGAAFGILVVVLIVDIIFISLAIHFALKCSRKNGWPMWATLLFIVLLFVPYIGGVLSLATIIYGITSCKN